MTTPDIAPVPTASPDGAGPGERAHREPVEARLIATGTVLDSLVQARRERIEELRARIEQMLPHPQVSIDVVVPYSRGDLVSRVHAEGEIDTVDYVEAGTHVVARVGAALAAEIEGAAAGVTVD